MSEPAFLKSLKSDLVKKGDEDTTDATTRGDDDDGDATTEKTLFNWAAFPLPPCVWSAEAVTFSFSRGIRTKFLLLERRGKRSP